MNEILPRLGSQQAKGRRIILAGRKNNSLIGVHSSLPHKGGGVSSRVVLLNSGFKSGRLVRVIAYNPEAEKRGIEEAARRKAAKEAEEQRRAAKKAEAEKRAASLREAPIKVVVSGEEKKPKFISGHGYRFDIIPEGEPTESRGGITEAEERLADLLGAAQEMKPLADEVLGEPKAFETSKTELGEGTERGLIIPELPLGGTLSKEKPRKKRGRNGRRVDSEASSVVQEVK